MHQVDPPEIGQLVVNTGLILKLQRKYSIAAVVKVLHDTPLIEAAVPPVSVIVVPAAFHDAVALVTGSSPPVVAVVPPRKALCARVVPAPLVPGLPGLPAGLPAVANKDGKGKRVHCV